MIRLVHLLLLNKTDAYFALICSIWFSVVHIHMPIVHIKLGDYHRKLGKLVIVLPPRALPPATPLPPLMKLSGPAHAARPILFIDVYESHILC